MKPCCRSKNGKRHAYWALVESHRTARGPRHRHTAIADLLGIPPEKINEQRLYRALGRALFHKEALQIFLENRLGSLFDLEYDLLVYDVTSTYFTFGHFQRKQRTYDNNWRTWVSADAWCRGTDAPVRIDPLHVVFTKASIIERQPRQLSDGKSPSGGRCCAEKPGHAPAYTGPGTRLFQGYVFRAPPLWV